MYTIILDTYYDLDFGHDQAFVTYPVVFPTVGVTLQSTPDLIDAANKLRIGLEPTDDILFTIGINDFTPSKLDNCISAIVDETDDPDGEVEYHIDLTEEEQVEIFKALDKECREKLGQSCAELLDESRRDMDEPDVDMFSPGD